MTTSGQETPRTIWSELETWANTFKRWQRFALCNIVRHSALTEDLIDQVYVQFLYDNNLGPAPNPALDIPSSIAGRPATAPEGGVVYLKALSNLRGANALPQDAVLLFSPALTIIYGGNGVGKSGFARVLSSGCFCRNKPKVLANIYAEGKQPALDATIVLTTADRADKIVELSATQEIPDLKRISVFDTAEARTYLTEQNPLGFKPLGFDVFPELVAVYEKLSRRLNGEIAQRNKANTFHMSFIAPESDVSRFVTALSGSTEIEKLNHLATFGEVETARLTEVGRQIIELQTQSVETALVQLNAAKSDLEAIQGHLAAALVRPELGARLENVISIAATYCDATIAKLGNGSADSGNRRRERGITHALD